MTMHSDRMEALYWFRGEFQRKGLGGLVVWIETEITKHKRWHQEWLARIAQIPE